MPGSGERFVPKILVFSTNTISDPGIDLAGSSHMHYPPSVLTIALFGWLFVRTAREGEERQELLELAAAGCGVGVVAVLAPDPGDPGGSCGDLAGGGHRDADEPRVEPASEGHSNPLLTVEVAGQVAHKHLTDILVKGLGF